jgi:hypothetical protein
MSIPARMGGFAPVAGKENKDSSGSKVKGRHGTD